MTRFMALPVCVLTCALLCVPVRADDPPKKLSPEERKELEAKRKELSTAGIKAYEAGKPAEAIKAFQNALEVARRLYTKADFPDGHDNLAAGLGWLGFLYDSQGNPAEAEPLLKDALAMYKRLFKDDHPSVARSLSNLALLYQAQGKLAEAEPLFKDALAMRRRLFKGDHPDVALSLNNLAALYRDQARLAEAEPLCKDALAMGKRLMLVYAKQKSEGEALTFTSSQPLTRDTFLSVARARIADTARPYDPAIAYPAVWGTKGMVARVYERRQLQARAAAADPALSKMLAEMTDARRRRAELLLAPATSAPGAIKKRQDDLAALEKTIAKLNEALPQMLPAIARTDKLDAATVSDLQRVLPADAAVVDYIRYTFFEWDDTKPTGQKQKRTERYLAFVVTREKVVWVDLDTEAAIKPAVTAWRSAITSGKEIPPPVPAKVRELVWEKVRKALPAGIQTVYVCPDHDLCKVPFAALPGDRPGTILLEDYAVAAIPHAPFLLDKLWPQEPLKNPPTSALVVGGVKYDADLSDPAPSPNAVASRGGPLVKPGATLGWGFLANTVGEADGVSETATRKKLPVTRIEGDKATPLAVVAALPKAKYAHFATHGFFADESFRSAFQLSDEDYKQSWRGERIGKAANSPLVMTGLVLAGANNPKTPGRGIVTGEQLIDLDLSGLELSVLSACETGLGDVAGGEGAFGLQRAFHYAGAKNVVCSLWKVPDAPTAALMGLFYQNLWGKNLSPLESLRQAQLEIFRNPQKIPELAKGFRGKFEEVPGMGGEVEVKPSKAGKAPPLLWAAFTLSGPGK
jgi:CHAT domain-containing protein/tetratricopeptide (TPR) repeat protein